MRSPSLNNLPDPPQGSNGWPWTEEIPPLPEKTPSGSPWPRISIVTACLNRASFLEATIRSVLLQGYPNLEYVIIDGGSKDQSLEVIEKYSPWLSYWVSEPDRGHVHALNKGFMRTHGDVVGWLNADDLFATGAFALVGESASDLQISPILIGDCLCLDEHGESLRTFVGAPQTLEDIIQCRVVLPQPSIFFARYLFERFGYLEESLDLSMDYEFFLRVASTYPFRYIPHTLSIMRDHPENKTTRAFLPMVKQILSVSRRYWGSPHTPAYWGRFFRAQQVQSWACLKAADREYPLNPKCAFSLLALMGLHYPPNIFSRTSMSLLARTVLGDKVITALRRFTKSECDGAVRDR
jgi:glycosyltransferase involved in cell wall biosynthesis